jgi:hypothetical protein
MKLSRWTTLFIVVLLIAVTIVAAACSSNESAQPTPTVQSNQVPSIISLVADPASLVPGDGATISCEASDPDGDALNYTWEYTGGTLQGTGSTVTWIAPSVANTYTVKVTVSDGNGGAANSSVAIVVASTLTPTLTPTPTSTETATPTPTPTPSEGSIDIKSSPAGAKVIIDGVDTGSITPYVATHVSAGNHTLKLEYAHYKWRSGNMSVNGGEPAYVNWALTYADTQTLAIQPDGAAGKDAYVYELQPNDAYGATGGLAVDGESSTSQYRTYIQFGLSSIPSTAVIESATLGLYYYISPGMEVQAPVGVYRVTSIWNESTITWNNQPASNPAVIATVLVPASWTNTFLSWDVTSLVSSWHVGRGLANVNYGMVLMDTDESTYEGGKGFYSSDYTTASERPNLTITYYNPAS